MDQINVIVIDDSAFMRKMISDILSSDSRLNVMATARNGEDGLHKIATMSPDVVTLDIEMPVMDGITALKKIMENHPLPVVILSGATEKDSSKTVQAMANGAVDFIEKPSGVISLDIQTIKQEIIKKVIDASKARVTNTVSKTDQLKPAQPQLHSESIVCIGTSTGGPRALQKLLTSLPEDLQAPILIVQHMPAHFTTSLANRLNQLSALQVKEAVHGEIIQNGVVYIAPGDYHMQLRKAGRVIAIELTRGPLRSGHRPSVDVLFESFADIPVNKLTVILTGMGKDGAEGVLAIKEKDTTATIIAEAKESAVIDGMPKAAIKTKCVTQVLHIDQIGEAITRLINKPRRV